MLTMIAVSLQSTVVVRCAQMVFFLIFAGLMGRRVRLLPPAVMLLSVVVANLFSPNGRVLFSVWRLDITYGALRLGLMKGTLFIGLIYISRVSVGPGLKFPGRFGALLLKTFAYFEQLTEKWPLTHGDVLGRIDELLLTISRSDAGSARGEPRGPEAADGRRGGVIAAGGTEIQPYRRNLLAAAVLLTAGWGPYIASWTLIAADGRIG